MSEYKDTSVIPRGPYCYQIIGQDPKTQRLKVKQCPYWGCTVDGEDQVGYCLFLGIDDGDAHGWGTLWDGVKECGENLAENSEDEW